MPRQFTLTERAMLLRNYTPFCPLIFESKDVQRRVFGVLVLRGTFCIVPNKTIRPVADQVAIVETDAYHGEVGRSSIMVESDLVPFKRRADIHVIANAIAPRGEPAR